MWLVHSRRATSGHFRSRNLGESIFLKCLQNLWNIILELSYEQEITTKDVWGAGERKMYFRTSVSRVISRAGKFKKIGINESNTLHQLFF